MDPKHEFDPDITMEPKVRYKLRSSLKKTKPRNPAGSLDNSDSDDTGIIPPLRRVSFASSNYVKPFLDDPEKNTIWDNTYEEEVNHTDSTKSDTNNLLESKSHICNTRNTIYDQSMVNMEFTCLDHTLKIEPLRNTASETGLDDSCSLPVKVKNRNMTVFEADLEFTCQWKNNIIELNQFQNLPTNQGNLEKNTTTFQEESMNMTCRCLSSNQSKRINTEDKENMLMTATGCNTFSNRKEIISLNESRMEFTCVLPSNIVEIDSKTTTINTENKENIYGDFANVKFNNLNANESNMEFTCVLPRNIVEIGSKTTTINTENKENIYGDFANVKFNNLNANESNMEFTYLLPNETDNHARATSSENKENIFLIGGITGSKSINDTNKENTLLSDNIASCLKASEKENICSQNDSEMEFTCLIPNNIVIKGSETKDLDTTNRKNLNRSKPTLAVDFENEGNIPFLSNLASCSKPVFSCSKVSKKVICSQDDSDMEFTCLIPNNILKNESAVKDLDTTNNKNFIRSKPAPAMHFENKENIHFFSNQASSSKPVFSCSKVSEKDIYSKNDSKMEFTETIKQHEELISNTNKENVQTVVVPDVLIIDNEPKNILCQNIEEKENLLDADCAGLSKIHFIKKETSHLQTKTDITGSLPKKALQMRALSPEIKENSLVLTNTNTGDSSEKIANKFNEHHSFSVSKIYACPKDKLDELPQPEKAGGSYSNPELSQNNLKKYTTTNSQNTFKEPEVIASQTKGIPAKNKPLKIKEFGNIPIAVDIADDLSIDQNLQMQTRSPEVKENALILTNTNDSSEKIVNKFNEHNSFSISKIYACPKDILDELPQPENADGSYSNPELSQNNLKIYTTTNSQNTFKEPEVIASQTTGIQSKNKPLKIKEFGNIPIAVDITDISIDQNIQMRARSPEIKANALLLTNSNYSCEKITDKFNEHHSFSVSKIYACSKDKLDELPQPEKADGSYSNPELSQNNLKKFTTTNSQNTFKEPKVIATQSKDLPSKNKPLKIKEFGNIPIAVDITDSSIDQNIYDHSKDLPPNISTENYSLKEKTYTIPRVNSQSNNRRNTNINEMTYSIHQDEIQTKTKPVIHETLSKTEDDKNNRDRSLDDNLKHMVPPNCPTAFSGKNTDESIYYDENICMDNKKIEQMPIIRQTESPSNTSLKKENENINLFTEECSLIDSTLPSLHEEDFDDLEASLKNKITKDIYTSEEINDLEIQRDNGLSKISPKTKVIYSEPIKTVSGEFPSMHTTIYPLNFSHHYSIEDTQQLIQATFSKPSDNIDFENSNNSNSEIEEANMLQKCKKPGVISIDKNAFQNESMVVQSIFNNIKEKLINYEYEDVNYDEIRKSINLNKEIQNKMKKLLQNFSLPEFHVPNLEARRRKMSPSSVSVDGNSTDSFLYSEEDNYDKSVMIEPIISLHEKIVNLCDRSNKILSVKNFEDDLYVFSSFYDCLRIFVSIHPEDHRVIEIKTKSLLNDSADPIYHFLIKKTMDKLKHSSLKSYLGSYFDVLTLLDHIWLTVEDVINFHYEFLSLQKLYPTLAIHPDLYLCLEILQERPPTWCKIRFDMTSVTKVNSDSLQVETIIGSVNQEHLKQILRDVNEGVDSLKNLACNVYKYFKMSVKTLESIKLF